jgi:hypothetical protein
MSRGSVRASLVALLALLAAACVSVPTEGPVVEGRPAGDPVPPPNVAVIPTGPREGDSPVDIAEGFLASMSSYEPGYPTARAFLTPDAAAAWSPESGIAVYGAGEGSRNLSATDDGVQISLALEAEVAADGTYLPEAGSPRLVLDLAMVEVAGEWRIDTPPDGLVMTAFDFNREFAAFASYFFDPEFDVLVPDLTYLPVRGNLPTLLVEELLDGASAWLEPGVRSAIDPGVSLTSGSVVQVGTVARVDLTPQVALAQADQRDLLAAQLAWTLRQAPGVSEVALLSEGQPVPLPSSETGVVTTDTYAFYDPSTIPAGDLLFAIADQAVVRVDDDSTTPVPGPLGEAGRYRSVAVGLTATRGAAVSADGSAVTISGLSEGATSQTYDLGGNVAAPSFDRNGRAWLVSRAPKSSRVLVVESDRAPVEVDSELLGTRLERLTIAADGVRAAGVYTDEGEQRLMLALVLHQRGGTIALGQVRDVPLGGVEPVDVAWASATALAVLGRAGDQVQPFLVELSNASLSSRGLVQDAVTLAAAPGQPLVIAAEAVAQPDDQTGPALLRQDALQEWAPIAQASAPTYPG